MTLLEVEVVGVVDGFGVVVEVLFLAGRPRFFGAETSFAVVEGNDGVSIS